MNSFLAFWLTGWTVGCAFLVSMYLAGGKMPEGAPLWLVWPFVGAWFVVAYLLLYSLFARKTFKLMRDFLEVRTKLGPLKWETRFVRNSIVELKQVKDGGEGEDSFPSWGLKIRSNVDHTPLVES